MPFFDWAKPELVLEAYRFPRVNGKSTSNEAARLFLEDALDQVLRHAGPRTRSKSYWQRPERSKPRSKSRRHEEKWIIEGVKNRYHIDELGLAINHQIPLKDTRPDKFGKIDLVTCLGRVLTIVEVKYGSNHDSLTRAVLEIASYYQIANRDKLVADFREDGGLRLDARIRKAVLLVAEGNQRPAAWSAAETNVEEARLAQKLDVAVFGYDIDRKVIHLVRWG